MTTRRPVDATGSTRSVALREVHEVLADLILDDDHRARWNAAPSGYARGRLPAGPARSMVERLPPGDVELAAVGMVAKSESRSARDGAGADATRPDAARTRRAVVPARSIAAPGQLAPRPEIRPAVGCALRPALIGALFGHLDLVEVWEHNVDWYLGDDAGRTGATRLASYAATAPVALHSLGMSVGSVDCLDDRDRIDGVRRLAGAVGARHVSDHLAVVSVGTRRLPHFLPLWRVPEQLDVVVANVDGLQDRLGVRFLLENPTLTVDPGGDVSTSAFLNEVVQRTGCGLLLDLENLRVNQANGHLDAAAELDELDLSAVVEVHVAGGTDRSDDGPAEDTHDQPVTTMVLDLLADVLPRLEHCEHVILERDDRFAERAEVVTDLERVHALVDPIRRPVTDPAASRSTAAGG